VAAKEALQGPARRALQGPLEKALQATVQRPCEKSPKRPWWGPSAERLRRWHARPLRGRLQGPCQGPLNAPRDGPSRRPLEKATREGLSRRYGTVSRGYGPSRRRLEKVPQNGAFRWPLQKALLAGLSKGLSKWPLETVLRNGHSRRPLETSRGPWLSRPDPLRGRLSEGPIPPLERGEVPELCDPIRRGPAGAQLSRLFKGP